MVELEILFSSGQGIIVPMEDRETALRFMQRAMEHRPEAKAGLFHLSTPYEEVLLDLDDISFIRLKKENYPRLGHTLKIPAHSSFQEESDAVSGHYASRAEHEEAIRHRREAERQGDERTFMVDADGNVNTRTTDSYAKEAESGKKDSYAKAEDRLRQAEAKMEQLEGQRRKLEAEQRRAQEAYEDEIKDAQARKNFERFEIDQEIKRMKDKHKE